MFKTKDLNGTSNKSDLPWLQLEGESPADPALLFCPTSLAKKNQKVNGKLFLTSFRLFFKSDVSIVDKFIKF